MARRPQTRAQDSSPMREIGASSGQLDHQGFPSDFVSKLRGNKAISTYRDMMDNDATIGAILTAITQVLKSVDWHVDPFDEDAESLKDAEFVETVLEDMSHTWDDFIGQCLTFLGYGFSFFEIVYKRRVGPGEKDATRRSKHDDGMIGIRKIAYRPQWTLQRWVLDDEGGVSAFVQSSSRHFSDVPIPIERGLLFRTTNSSPSGRSILRNSFRSWHYLTRIQEYEAVAIERELNGLPMARIPAQYLSSTATTAEKAVKAEYEKILRDVRKNEQGFVMIPSDPWRNGDGTVTQLPMVDFKLISSEGTRDIQTGPVITRYSHNMAQTALADFIMLGQNNVGSFALSKSKTDLFLTSLTAYNMMIASVINRHLMPRLWEMNGKNQSRMPTVRPGEVAAQNLEELGGYVQRLASAGMPLFPDEDLSNTLRAAGGLPDQPEDPEMMGVEDDPEDA